MIRVIEEVEINKKKRSNEFKHIWEFITIGCSSPKEQPSSETIKSIILEYNLCDGYTTKITSLL